MEGKGDPVKILLIWLLLSQGIFALLQIVFCQTFLNIILVEEILNPVNNNTAFIEQTFTKKRVNKNLHRIVFPCGYGPTT